MNIIFDNDALTRVGCEVDVCVRATCGDQVVSRWSYNVFDPVYHQSQMHVFNVVHNRLLDNETNS